jgi:hypothetical protein
MPASLPFKRNLYNILILFTAGVDTVGLEHPTVGNILNSFFLLDVCYCDQFPFRHDGPSTYSKEGSSRTRYSHWSQSYTERN